MLRILNTKISLKHKPFIIAEMSGNHNQSLDRALEIVKAASDAGAHALKLQTYTADSLTLDISEGEFFIKDKNSQWQGKSLYELYKQAYTPWDWHKPIMDYAKKLNLLCFSSPFDGKAVDFLEDLKTPAYKIASFENGHLPLIKKVLSTGKPVIISTGMASLAELDETVKLILESDNNNFALLKCTSNYPATPKNSNILTIPHMRDLFKCEVGLSDHTLGLGASIAAVSHGASIIEKHFTLSRRDGGVDSAFSLEPDEMNKLVIETERAWDSLGEIKYGIVDEEKGSMTFRRSIYISEDIEKGEKLTNKNMRIIRPGFGLLPKYYDSIKGKKVNRNLKKGTAVTWEVIG
ncbi:MAG: pseudaminic acid synthase [Halieaceae bacterium]|nr:pseudaminic acid synthase [Halieaceae bacterium]